MNPSAAATGRSPDVRVGVAVVGESSQYKRRVRWLLEHHVIRARRSMSHEMSEHDTPEDAYRAADLLAALTLVSPWRQELVDRDTGQRWFRSFDTAWEQDAFRDGSRAT
jgi:hypothetical protein